MKLKYKKFNLAIIVVIIALLIVFYFTIKYLDLNSNVSSPDDNKSVTFDAKIGKFRLELPKDYVVINNVDGQTQNGPRTVVEIGQTGDSNGLVTSPYLGKAVITATPLQQKSINEVLDAYNLDEPIVSEQDVEIDSQPANLLIINGEIYKELYYFEQTDILYVLYFENTDQSDILADQKNAIIDGFTLIE